MKIRKFNAEGHAAWKSFYNEVFLEIKKEAKGSKITTEDIKNGYNNDLKKKYLNLKNSKNFSEELDESKDFEIKNFKNSYELGLAINKSLSNYEFYKIDTSKVWDWLSMILFEQIFVPGKIRGCAVYRYVKQDDFFSSFRHLIRGPCWAINQYGVNAKIFTYTQTFRQNDWLEQYIKVTAFREMKVLAEVCMELYYDYKNDEAIPGTSKSSEPDKAGIFPRLRNKISQFNKVKFIWGMDSKAIINMLPNEFNKFKNNITK
tara:strand:+ start:727 stop:1506 length:780 start_codon:yes stop_codon:yes gene_type:complete